MGVELEVRVYEALDCPAILHCPRPFLHHLADTRLPCQTAQCGEEEVTIQNLHPISNGHMVPGQNWLLESPKQSLKAIKALRLPAVAAQHLVDVVSCL